MGSALNGERQRSQKAGVPDSLQALAMLLAHNPAAGFQLSGRGNSGSLITNRATGIPGLSSYHQVKPNLRLRRGSPRMDDVADLQAQLAQLQALQAQLAKMQESQQAQPAAPVTPPTMPLAEPIQQLAPKVAEQIPPAVPAPVEEGLKLSLPDLSSLPSMPSLPSLPTDLPIPDLPGLPDAAEIASGQAAPLGPRIDETQLLLLKLSPIVIYPALIWFMTQYVIWLQGKPKGIGPQDTSDLPRTKTGEILYASNVERSARDIFLTGLGNILQEPFGWASGKPSALTSTLPERPVQKKKKAAASKGGAKERQRRAAQAAEELGGVPAEPMVFAPPDAPKLPSAANGRRPQAAPKAKSAPRPVNPAPVKPAPVQSAPVAAKRPPPPPQPVPAAPKKTPVPVATKPAPQPVPVATKPAPQVSAKPAAQPAADDATKSRLAQLQELLDDGLITEEEYRNKKEDILSVR